MSRSIVCRQCRSTLAAGTQVCPRCGAMLPAWQAFAPMPSMWRRWRDNGIAGKFMGVAAVAAILYLVFSLTYSDVRQLIAVERDKHALRADSDELLLREQQRLNLPQTDSLAQVPAKTRTALPPARNPRELFDGLRVITREVGESSRYRQAQVQARIDALHLEDLLLPQNLLSPEGLNAGRAINRNHIALLNYSLAINRASRIELQQRLRALAGELPEGRAILASHARNAERGLQEDMALLENRRAVIGKIERIYALAEARLGRVRLQNGTLIFDDARDVDEYNRLIGDIDTLAGQRATIERVRQERMDIALKEIDKQRLR